MRGFLLVILFANLLGLSLAMPSNVSACNCYTEDSELVTIDDYCADVCGEDEATSSAFESDSSEGICTCSNGSKEYAGCEYACDIDGYSTEDTKTIVDDGSSSSTSRKLLTPVLSIDIPNLIFSDVIFSEKEGREYISVNYLGEYIAAVYKYLLGISMTIAIVMLMVSGLQWSLGGQSPEAIGKAKTRIKNAVTGLVLLLGTYLILFTVNPNLLKLQFPTLQLIDYEPLIADSGDASGSISSTELEEKLSELGINCASSDESGDVTTIARSFVGKVTYRFGAKGGDPPYSGEKDRMLGSHSTSSFCPEGTICSDCSGFTDIIRQCAGLTSLGENGGTAGIFASAEKITECGDDYVSTESESIDIVEGDLVGYKPGDRTDKPKYGHVWMYIGDGKVISAMGGDSGRASGNAVQIQSLTSICKEYPLRYAPRD